MKDILNEIDWRVAGFGCGCLVLTACLLGLAALALFFVFGATPLDFGRTGF